MSNELRSACKKLGFTDFDIYVISLPEIAVINLVPRT